MDQEVPDLSRNDSDEFDPVEEDNSDFAVPVLIGLANEEFDRMEEDNPEVDEETPLSVLLAKKQTKDPEPIAPFILSIYNLKAEDLNAPRTNKDGSPAGPFRARFWTDPGDETIHWASTFEFGLSPSWPDITTITFNNLIDWGFLYVEIVMHGVEPCTSDGDSTIGRAKVPLPGEADVQVGNRSELVKSDGGECSIGVGHVMVTMKWERDWAKAVGAF